MYIEPEETRLSLLKIIVEKILSITMVSAQKLSIFLAVNLCARSPVGPCGVVKKAKDLVKWLRRYNENVVVRERFFVDFEGC